jgi:hypothetical protein
VANATTFLGVPTQYRITDMDFLKQIYPRKSDETDKDEQMKEKEKPMMDDPFMEMQKPDDKESVDDGAENVMMGLDDMDLDPFDDPDDDGSFEVFDDLEAAKAGDDVEMRFDGL